MSRLGSSLIVATTCLFAATAHAGPCGNLSDSQASDLFPLPVGDAWGYVGKDGEWGLAPEWRQVRPFSEGLAAVETEDGWGVIDSSGDYVVALGARDADAVVIEGKAHHLSPYKPFSEGCSAVTPEDGQAHYITRDGTRWDPSGFTDHEVLDLGSFSEGLARVLVADQDGSTVGWIDTEGEWAIEPSFHAGGDFSEGRAPAARSDTNWGYIDTDGELVFPRKFILAEADVYAEGLHPVTLNGERGYMDEEDWAIREITFPDGSSRTIRAGSPFHEGRAGVKPGPVWINTQGRAVVIPKTVTGHTICNENRMPRYHGGLLPLVVGDGTNICGNPPDIAYEGPGDSRSGPEQMLWALPWARDKLVWLDRDGREAIDATDCRRPAGMEPLPVESSAGVLAAGAYRMELSGTAQGSYGPARADAPCNESQYTLDDSQGTNQGGPWRLSFRGEADWQDHPVNTSLSLNLPEGLATGTHEVGKFDDNAAVNGLLWLFLRDRRAPDLERPDTYSTQGGTLTLEKFDRESATGRMELELASRDAPERTITVSVGFREIPYAFAPEIEMTELTGALATMQEEMPDDPLVNFFQPIEVKEADERLSVVFGPRGPNLELVFPAGHSGSFKAGPDEAVSASLSEVPVSAEGSLSRADGDLAGEISVEIQAHPRFDGNSSMTLRFAHVPFEASSDG
ncbi:MAG: WG repeat-containing protein [Halomonas sp.]|uniref:WG repeat-containing protein n=1 Tax=Halomonas sp. TaxID=1486246 RepID=UPI002ACD4F6D|nr:WG repeat-containing protein [Halomonas sp.]MDZ7852842.1 WG repeat-containing protein [Halomonas sp.]